MTIRVLVLCLLQPRNLEANRRLYSVSDGVAGNVYVIYVTIKQFSLRGMFVNPFVKMHATPARPGKWDLFPSFHINAHGLPGA